MNPGLQIFPSMSVKDIIAIAIEAEQLGYSHCLLADEGFLPDPYVALGAIAASTTRIKLGPVTNGYTRHPAASAMALATLHELSSGRALVTLVAGGAIVLKPMGLNRDAPLAVIRDTITIMRKLWSGERITWQGERYNLDGAKSGMGAQRIPIWVAARGPKMIEIAGELADGVWLMGKADLAPALAIAQARAASRVLSAPVERIFQDQVANTPALIQDARIVCTFLLNDSPPRLAEAVGISAEKLAAIKTTFAEHGVARAAALVDDDLLRQLVICGDDAECTREIHRLKITHQLDTLIVNIMSTDLNTNLGCLRDVAKMVT